MGTRLELQEKLEELLAGTGKAYFQAPSNIQMVYPAIVYALANINTEFASNVPYNHANRYQLTIIDRDPDSPLVDKVKMLPRCVFSRRFVADKLNHTIFNLYF